MHLSPAKAADTCSASEGWLKGLVTDLRASWINARATADNRTHRAFRQDARLSEMVANALNADSVLLARELGGIGEPEARRVALGDLVNRLELDWLNGEISLDQASEAYWALGRALRQITAQRPVTTWNSPQAPAVLVYVPLEESHVFGAQFLTDQLREAGANVVPYLQKTYRELVAIVSKQHFDLIAVSIGYDQSLLGLADAIAEVRRCSVNQNISVVLGGRVFDQPASSYEFIGADRVVIEREDPIEQILRVLPGSKVRKYPRHA